MRRVVKWSLGLAAALALVGCGGSQSDTLDEVGRPAAEVRFEGPEARIKIDLPGAKDHVRIVRLENGDMAYLVERVGAGTDRVLTPDEFAALVYRSKTRASWLEAIFNITSPAGILWVSLGLLGQLIFTGRMLVQWIASERTGRSVIPVAFWWMSLGGAVMLVIYFIWRRDIVGILGQGTGLFIYARNLILIRRSKG